jgi:hypothetical protein
MDVLKSQASAIVFQRGTQWTITRNFKMDCRRQFRPRLRKELRTLFLRKSPDIKPCVSATRTGSRIGSEEIWFDANTRRVEARAHEFPASKLRAHQKQIDLLRPGLQVPVQSEHACDGSGGGPRIAIASMNDRTEE